MIIKQSLLDTIQGSLFERGNAKDFLDGIRENFKKVKTSNKAERENLIDFL